MTINYLPEIIFRQAGGLPHNIFLEISYTVSEIFLIQYNLLVKKNIFEDPLLSLVYTATRREEINNIFVLIYFLKIKVRVAL